MKMSSRYFADSHAGAISKSAAKRASIKNICVRNAALDVANIVGKVYIEYIYFRLVIRTVEY